MATAHEKQVSKEQSKKSSSKKLTTSKNAKSSAAGTNKSSKIAVEEMPSPDISHLLKPGVDKDLQNSEYQQDTSVQDQNNQNAENMAFHAAYQNQHHPSGLLMSGHAMVPKNGSSFTMQDLTPYQMFFPAGPPTMMSFQPAASGLAMLSPGDLQAQSQSGNTTDGSTTAAMPYTQQMQVSGVNLRAKKRKYAAEYSVLDNIKTANPLHFGILTTKEIQVLVDQGVPCKKGRFTKEEDHVLRSIISAFMRDRHLENVNPTDLLRYHQSQYRELRAPLFTALSPHFPERPLGSLRQRINYLYGSSASAQASGALAGVSAAESSDGGEQNAPVPVEIPPPQQQPPISDAPSSSGEPASKRSMRKNYVEKKSDRLLLELIIETYRGDLASTDVDRRQPIPVRSLKTLCAPETDIDWQLVQTEFGKLEKGRGRPLLSPKDRWNAALRFNLSTFVDAYEDEVIPWDDLYPSFCMANVSHRQFTPQEDALLLECVLEDNPTVSTLDVVKYAQICKNPKLKIRPKKLIKDRLTLLLRSISTQSQHFQPLFASIQQEIARKKTQFSAVTAEMNANDDSASSGASSP